MKSQTDFFDMPVEIEEVDQHGHPIVNQELQYQQSQDERYFKPKKRHKWAFFLAFMFMGIFIAEFSGIQSFELIGISIGFLFYVNPIYDAVLSALKLDAKK